MFSPQNDKLLIYFLKYLWIVTNSKNPDHGSGSRRPIKDPPDPDPQYCCLPCWAFFSCDRIHGGLPHEERAGEQGNSEFMDPDPWGQLSTDPPDPDPQYCCLVMSTIPKRKHKRSDIEANYRNEYKTFWFGPHIIGTKAKHFVLVQNNFYWKEIVYVLAQKFWDKAKQFDLVCKLS